MIVNPAGRLAQPNAWSANPSEPAPFGAAAGQAEPQDEMTFRDALADLSPSERSIFGTFMVMGGVGLSVGGINALAQMGYLSGDLGAGLAAATGAILFPVGAGCVYHLLRMQCNLRP